MSHRSHPGEIDIHLDSTRNDIKPYLDQLNPILQNIVSILQSNAVIARKTIDQG